MTPFKLDLTALRQAAAQSPPGIIDGRRIADAILAQLGERAAQLRRRGIEPRLAVVQVEGDAASSVYVRHKIKACAQVGIQSELLLLPPDTDAHALHERLQQLNADERVHGVLLQLPLPASLSPEQALAKLDPRKDVDGLHPHNLGALMAWAGELEPCTPRGCMRLLDAYGVELRGARALVVGRSALVGRPMAQMLMRADATVTVAHRHTRELSALVAQADVLVVATGVARLIPGEWIKPGAVVLDVGTSRGEDNKLVGDVCFEDARQRARLISPVPGGVGPMTVATLMENTLRAASREDA